MRVSDFDGFACVGVDGQLFWLRFDDETSCERIFKDNYQEASDKVRLQFERALKDALVSSAVEASPLGELIAVYLEKLSSNDKSEWEALAALDERMEAYLPALKELARETETADRLVRDILRSADNKGLKVSLVVPDTASLLEALEEARNQFRDFLATESLAAKALSKIKRR